jgi:hypothetical protein
MTKFTPAQDINALTDAQLADEIGRLDALKKAIEAKLEAAKDRFKERDIPEITGTAFRIVSNKKVTWRLDTAAVKKEMGEAWYDKRCKQSLTVSTLIRSVNDTEIDLAKIA